MRRLSRAFPLLALPAGLATLVLLTACGGSGASSSASPSSGSTATGSAAIILSDAPSDQWSAVEVVVTKVTLVDKNDQTKEVVAFQGATAKINLVDLDSVGELLATAQIPVGTYNAMRISIDPSNVTLVKADGTPVPSSSVKVVGGTNVWVPLSSDLVVTQGSSNALQLDFDLSHPLFLVQLPDGTWVMNLQVHFKPNANGMMGMAQMQFHHRRGTIASLGASSFVLHADSGNDLTVNVDSGAWFFDADAKAVGRFAGLAAGKYALVSLRMQSDGSLWAVRVWYSANPLPDWTPEGHVYGVDRTNNKLFVSTDTGTPRAVVVDSDTAFTYHRSLALGTGPSALADLWAGFKVSVTVKDPLAAPLHAASINVQRAVDGGRITAATATDFTYANAFSLNRTYAYANGFSWWYLGFPGITSTDTGAFASAVTGAGDVRVRGLSDLTWNATSSAWDAANVIFMPVGLPLGAITTSYNGGQIGFTFTDSTGTVQALPVTLDSTAGQQPSVVEVNNQAGAVTVTPLDASTWSAKLVAPTPVKVAVVPKPDGTFAAYAVAIFTGF